MALLNKTVLKGFYESGDKPTQTQFASLIDSCLNLLDDHSLLGLRQYDISLTYLPGDTVIYNEGIYICQNETTGTFNPIDWSEVAGTIPGALVYQGTWDANSNTPDLQTATPNQGDYYVVSVAGNTNLDGITDWQVGDWAIYNGTAWEKVDNTDMVSDGENVAGTGIGVFKTKSGTLLQFKKIQNSDGSVSVIEDGSSSFIDFMINFDDAGTAVDRTWSASKISTELGTKADKVTGATLNNFASLDASGNLLDSGQSGSSFLPSTTDAADIPVTPAGNITSTDVQAALEELDSIKEPANPNIQAHIADMNNPHNTTKAQVGLGNVTNDEQLSLKFNSESETAQTTENEIATPANAITLNFTPAVAGTYAIEWYFELSKNTSVSTTIGAEVELNTSPIAEVQPRFTTNDQWEASSGFYLAELTTSSQRVDINYGKVTSTEGVAQIRRVRVRIIKS